MRRYWVDKGKVQEGKILLDGDVFRHICGVCRMEQGAHFELLTSESKAYFVELVDVQKKAATAIVKNVRDIDPLPEPHIHIALSVPKFAKMDLIVEKSVELGVKAIHPFTSDYSFVKKKSAISENKFKRWEKIVVSATQQCGRGELMQLHEPTDFSSLVEKFNLQSSAQGLFMYEGETQMSLRQATHALRGEKIQQIWAFIGSEGGFSNNEVEFMKMNKLMPISLGEQVLRVETACVALASILKYEFLLP